MLQGLTTSPVNLASACRDHAPWDILWFWAICTGPFASKLCSHRWLKPGPSCGRKAARLAAETLLVFAQHNV
jgi:hypothetical protein